MQLMWHKECNVLVIGAGLAGLCAAVRAAQHGARVIVATSAGGPSGASFYAGTWGLGLIEPRDNSKDAKQNLKEQICEVGQGVCNQQLVSTFVDELHPSLAWLQNSGMEFLEPQNPNQKEYIACFDKTVRTWHGLTHANMTRTFETLIKRLDITVLTKVDLIDLLEEDQDSIVVNASKSCKSQGSLSGAIFYHKTTQTFGMISAPAVVLATGGLGGLYQKRLTAPEVTSAAHALAVRHGATTTNLEFIQLMPTLTAPKRGIVFNEKTFRYLRFLEPACQPAQELLEARSFYGPFSCTHAGFEIDLLLAQQTEVGNDARVIYHNLPSPLPEFVATFATWLKDKGVSMDEPYEFSHFAHASNGGLAIDTCGHVEGAMPGLFAAGEVCGGMHGADRIGGLSSANCITFGRIAGEAAAAFAHNASCAKTPGAWPHELHCPVAANNSADMLLQNMRQAMTTYAMVLRCAKGLRKAYAQVERGIDQLLTYKQSSVSSQGATSIQETRELAQTLTVLAQLQSAHLMLDAMLKRTESLGAHYRCD